MRRLAGVVTLVALWCGVQAGGWTQYGSDSVKAFNGTSTPKHLNLQWYQSTPHYYRSTVPCPVVVDSHGTLYMANTVPIPGNIHGRTHDVIQAYDTHGVLQWNSTFFQDPFPTGSLATAYPALSPDERSLYVWYSCYLVAIDTATGNLTWRFSLDNCALSGGNLEAPTVDSEGYIYVRNHSSVYRMSPTVVGEALQYIYPTNSTERVYMSPPSVGRTHVAVSVSNKHIAVYHKDTGALAWSHTAASYSAWFSDLSPTMSSDAIYVATANEYRGGYYNGSILAFDLATGHQLWSTVLSLTRDTQLTNPMSLHEATQSLYVAAEKYSNGRDHYFLARLSMKDGKLSEFPADLQPGARLPLIAADGSVYLGDGNLVVQYAVDGSLVRNMTLQGTALASRYQFSQPIPVAIGGDGSLYVCYNYQKNLLGRYLDAGTVPQAPHFSAGHPAPHAITLEWDLPSYPTETGGLVLLGSWLQSSLDGGKTWKNVSLSSSLQLMSRGCYQVTGLYAATAYQFRLSVHNSMGQGPWGTTTTTTLTEDTLCPTVFYLYPPNGTLPGKILAKQPPRNTQQEVLIPKAKNVGGTPAYPGPEYSVAFEATNLTCLRFPYTQSRPEVMIGSKGSGIGVRYWLQVDVDNDGKWDISELFPNASSGHTYYPLSADGAFHMLGEPFVWPADPKKGVLRLTYWNVIGGYDSAVAIDTNNYINSKMSLDFWSNTSVVPCPHE